MTQLLDTNSVLPIRCHRCGGTIRKTINDVHTVSQLSCPDCGGSTAINVEDLKAAVQRAEFALYEAGWALGRTFKHT